MTDLHQSIFTIHDDTTFNQIALEVYKYQVQHIEVYRQFVEQLNRKTPTHYTEIPCLPISFFKTHRIAPANAKEEVLFKSSGTTGMVRSQHFVVNASMYISSFEKAYRQLMGQPEDQVILALLPNYMEQGHSSLVYMVEYLVKATQNPLSGFLLNQLDEVKERYNHAINSGKNVVIFGVSYALLDLAEAGVDLSKATIIETGGMKGRRKELTKKELHQVLTEGLSVPYISSEYGMTELLSQAYSNKNGLFECPPWMKIAIRDINDPLSYAAQGKSGGINVIDLANINSCSFIATEDLGKLHDNQFEILGRIDLSDIRGCNLLVN